MEHDTLVIEDTQVRLLVLTCLIESAEAKPTNAQGHGLRRDQLQALRNLAASDLAVLAKMREPRIHVRVDSPALDHGLRQLSHVRERAREIEFFIRNGATVSMLVALFKLSPADVAAWRRGLRLGSHRRPPMPAPGRREAICIQWHALRRGRERTDPTASEYRALHENFSDLSFATLYAVVNEFVD